MRVLAIDPGSEKSGWVLLENGVPTRWGWVPNEELLLDIRAIDPRIDLVIESVGHYGLPVGRDVFETVRWSGRFEDSADQLDIETTYIPRHDVLINLCGKRKGANDSTVRQALVDRYGGDAVAIGGKKCGVCHGVGFRGRGKARGPCSDCHHEGFGDDYGHPIPIGCGFETHKGPLYGLTGHCLSALAVGVIYIDQRKDGAT